MGKNTVSVILSLGLRKLYGVYQLPFAFAVPRSLGGSVLSGVFSLHHLVWAKLMEAGLPLFPSIPLGSLRRRVFLW